MGTFDPGIPDEKKTLNDVTEKYRAPALDRGLDILELLSTAQEPLPMSAITSGLGRSKGEIFRMVVVLERRGYIRRVEGGKFFEITNRLFELGMRNPPVRTLIEVAGPPMHDLCASVDQSCHIAVASGDQIVVVFGAEAEGYLSFAVRIGHRQPLLESASGRTLLAFQKPAVQEAWLDYEPGKRKRAALRKRARTIRDRGYEESASSLIDGILDIGAPVFDGRSPGAIASLTMPLVTHLKVREEQKAAIAAVCATARDITGQLSVGHERPTPGR